ncbi:MAG: restriction endonuclease subunit S [Intestinibacter bartlettii]|nr:restriction endonuclease subunit S [Intestinibacter bartlettii]
MPSCSEVFSMREMKDSGIEWIGEVPKHWECKKIKNVCSVIGSGTTPTSSNNEFYEDGVINWIQSGDIYGKTKLDVVSTLITKKAIKANKTLKIYTSPFIVMAMYGGSVGNTAISRIDACTNQACCCLKTNEFNAICFLYYWISMCKVDFLYKAVGGGQPNISQEKIKNQIFIGPPLEEQQRIADFLDEKCGEIDSLTKDIQEQIATLEEYKKSIITEAVTKGLDPNVEMKDSGIEWIGKVPKEWEVHPVYFYFGEGKEKNSALKENNLLSLSYGNIVKKDINTNGGLLPANFTTYNIVRQGDIIIRPTDLQNDKRSLRTGLVKERGIITSAYIDLVPNNNVNSRYFHYLLHSYDISKVFYNMGNGVRQGLNYSEFSKLKVLYPPVKEQQSIADFLDSKCVEIEASITTKKEQLETLAEYKKSLIYEYVTGKKEVK